MSFSGLSIANNTNLRYVDVRVEGALYIADLNIENNPDLFSFLLIPKGGHIIGSIIFENNRDLAVILLNVKHHWADVVQSQGKFVVNNSPRLESIYLKYLQEIKGLAFLQINNNTKLQKIDVPQITKIEDVGKFEISGNDALVTCYFPRLDVITATGSSSAFFLLSRGLEPANTPKQHRSSKIARPLSPGSLLGTLQ